MTNDKPHSDCNEVRLLADYLNGQPVHEMVPAVKIGERYWRLLASPGFAPGFASGDEIEAAPSERMGYRIVKRSGNIAVQLFLFECTAEDRTGIEAVIKQAGGWLDGGCVRDSGHLLIFTVPFTVGFPAIESAMSKIAGRYSVDRWMYGNIYDTRDGVTPLNWWI